jgi:RHS repeat-associated protein
MFVLNTYDPQNRWIASTVDADGEGPEAAQTTHFVYDENQIVLEFGNSGELTHRYLWGPAVDQLLADERILPLPLGEGGGEGSDLSIPGNVVWPLADHLGTIRDLAVHDAQTGITSVANHRVYDSFGKLQSETNAAVDCLFGFTGRPSEKASGLQNNLNRWYDPVTGRWASEDPIAFAGGDTNLDRYVVNSTTTASDPSGLITAEDTLSTKQAIQEVQKHLQPYVKMVKGPHRWVVYPLHVKFLGVGDQEKVERFRDPHPGGASNTVCRSTSDSLADLISKAKQFRKEAEDAIIGVLEIEGHANHAEGIRVGVLEKDVKTDRKDATWEDKCVYVTFENVERVGQALVKAGIVNEKTLIVLESCGAGCFTKMDAGNDKNWKSMVQLLANATGCEVLSPAGDFSEGFQAGVEMQPRVEELREIRDENGNFVRTESYLESLRKTQPNIANNALRDRIKYLLDNKLIHPAKQGHFYLTMPDPK